MLDFQADIHYNQSVSSETLLILLAGCVMAMALVAVFSLRRRKLSLLEYTAWGMLALLLPVIGPFLVVWLRPGQKPGAH